VKVAVVQGTRPEIIKNYPIVRALRRAGVPHAILHTNQHSTPQMRDRIYAQMQYAPTHVLPVPYRMGAAIDWLQSEYAREEITHVVVNGDTAAALVGAVSAMYCGIGVSHVEAGLRARDAEMLEERNRIMVDAIASLLFVYTDYERTVLESSADIRGEVFVEGNTTVDVLADLPRLQDRRRVTTPYVFATLHRREFTASRHRMKLVFSALSEIATRHCPVILPLHPRTEDAVDRAGLRDQMKDIWVIPPLDPFQAIFCQRDALAVMTDSGCVQEEAYILRVPCVTIRENTERKLTVDHHANRVTGFDRASILEAFDWAASLKRRDWPDIYGQPGVGDRIIARILTKLERSNRVRRRIKRPQEFLDHQCIA
jgi:UDP-N-acetylglucosamine 2-epimerase (non-hydrolysing)